MRAAAARAAEPGDTPTLTQPALKEWSAAVHAMLDGRQTVLLRKGGIHEKRFDARLRRDFLFFPTVAHSHAERVRPEHRDLLAAGGRRQHRERGRVAGRREGCRRR